MLAAEQHGGCGADIDTEPLDPSQASWIITVCHMSSKERVVR